VKQRLLQADALPLVLLAAVGHPDPAVRARVNTRLTTPLPGLEHWHTDEAVRDFLLRQHGTPLEPFVLDSLSLEIAVHLFRLVFIRKSPERTLRISSCGTFDDSRGLVVNGRLRTLYLERFAYGRRRLRRPPSCHFVAGMVSERLARFGRREPLVRAKCQAGTGYRLRLEGELPWPDDAALQARLDGTLDDLGRQGFRLEMKKGVLHFRPESPEALIRFSALLARGERLVFRGTAPTASGRVVVPLRPFEADAAELPAVAGYGSAEGWLGGAAAPLPELDEGDRHAIARWGYAPESWLDGPLLEALL
jgi:hypothetical protein